ncbi:MAG TPA: TlpA disulfide reductase family protein [Opitutaceae bacterium]|nr:TlpA disulfide reductase family protein [Opitutaceae bacterium]
MSSKAKVFLIALVLFRLVAPARAEVAVGAKFPALPQYAIEGTLPPEMAGKVVVVDFWASWCAPCRSSFPAFSELQKEFGANVVILGVSVDDKKSAYEKFVSRFKPAFATVRDEDHRLTSDVRVPTMPTSYVIDRSGKVRFVHAGFHSGTPAELRAQIRQLLEEKS